METKTLTGKANETMERKFKQGQRVEANGNKDCTIIRYPYADSNMVEVRFWQGSRLVGDAVVDELDIKVSA